MKIDHKSKTIHATRSETFMVVNYIEHTLGRKDVETWKIAWEIKHTSTNRK